MTQKEPTETWMLVRKGHPQRMKQRGGLVWPVARTQADAVKLAAFFVAKMQADPSIRPARVGSMQGETLEGHIRLAIEEGCRSIVVVQGWNIDGSPKFGEMKIDGSPSPSRKGGGSA